MLAQLMHEWCVESCGSFYPKIIKGSSCMKLFFKAALIASVVLFTSAANAAFINFDNEVGSASGYASQDNSSGTLLSSNSGATLELGGNRWIDILMNVTITSSSILKFSFEASGLNAELYGIGFDNNDTYTYGQIDSFAFFGGSQLNKIVRENPLNAFGNYSVGDGIVNYSLNIGDFFTGTFDRIIFVLDNDENQTGSFASFSNVEICDNVLVCQTAAITEVPAPSHLGFAGLALLIVGALRRKIR